MVVMKFGGTSVQDAEAVGRLVGIVGGRRRVAQDGGSDGPLVVASALAKVTDALIEVAGLARAGNGDDARVRVERLRTRHLAMAHALTRGERRTALEDELERLFYELSHLVRALAVLGEVSPRSLDALAAFGELASSRLVASALQQHGIPAAWVDARSALVTSAEFTSAQPDLEATRARLERHVRPLLARHEVPVLGGFVGATPDGLTTTLGRGGSDYSAAIFGACLDAVEIEIWTDVDGMLTADPRVVADPLLVPELSFDEASELAYFGAKVLHPSTILPAVSRNIPVRILNSRHAAGLGTRITGSPSTRAAGPTAIACKRGLMDYGFLRRVFEVFERHRTPVDVVTTSEVSVSMTIDDCRALDAIVADLAQFAQVACERDLAIVCAVGERLRSDPALAARVLGALEGLPLAMVSQGGSRKNITVVLPEANVADAMQRLHARFFAVQAA
jgi:aspartate kinase